MSFTVAGRGWHSIAVDVGGRFIAKFPEGAEAEEALRREASLLSAVRPRLTMAVPDMTIHEGPPLFSLHGKLPGGTLDGEGYARLDEEARRRLADDVALFLAELHAIEPAVMREPVRSAGGIRKRPRWRLSGRCCPSISVVRLRPLSPTTAGCRRTRSARSTASSTRMGGTWPSITGKAD
jgi:hypothetical protein